MNKEEALERSARGLPIESARELVFVLRQVQARVRERTSLWYLLNRFQRIAMQAADQEDE